MLKLISSNKIIFLGIFLIIIQTFFGASFDTATKLLGPNKNLLWYHYYAIGLSFPMISFIFFLIISKTIKTNLIFENKKDYFLPLFRGFTFIPIPIIIYYSLKQIPLNIFTPIIMTTPFFILIWSSILQKEIISVKYWIILIIGFAGTILIAKPTMFKTNIFIYLIFLVAAYNALTSVVVSKFSKNATALGYSFYNLLPLTLFCIMLFVIDPVKLFKEELTVIFIGGFLLFFASLLFNFIFHISGKFTRFISPFFFLQLIWASILGYLFFNETLDNLSLLGMVFIVVSGTLTIMNSQK
ncbi:DMT family transporter [Alphaproteobacteria bacterium]|nr:DMT family transporter [Alphaproteobacteria bacterium]